MSLTAKLRRPTLLALCTTALLAGCSNDGGPDRVPEPSEVRVVVLTDTQYVEYDTSEVGAEGSNMVLTLEDAGYDVVEVSKLSVDSISAVLASADVLVIPEQEEGDVLDTLQATGLDTLIANWVQDGGVLVSSFHWHHLNPMFGWDVAYADSAGDAPFTRDGRGEGTPFAALPDTLAENDATDWIDVASLPGGAIAPWRNGSNETVLFAAPAGDGWVVWLGYDWYDAAPNGEQDGGWIAALGRLNRF